jgi:hypothetical protein
MSEATRYPIATISGSMRFFDAMIEVANEFTAEGYIILMPFVHVIPPEQQKGNPVKAMLDDMHFRKIDLSELVIVVGGYIGESTQNEINYAISRGVPIANVRTELTA